jgi:RNA polymerase sigma-70 factor (sigma-E family)
MSVGVPAAGVPACWRGPASRSADDVTAAEEFAEFAETTSPRLRRMAFLHAVTGTPRRDLAQTALAKVFVSWRKIRRQDTVHAYATRTLVNTYLAHKRRKSNSEVLSGWLPETPAETPAPETRMVVLDALATLPPRCRAVVVLRYWADLSVDQAAAVLGCSPGRVKSHVASSTVGTVTPITTATNTPGKPIKAGKDPFALVITP